MQCHLINQSIPFHFQFESIKKMINIATGFCKLMHQLNRRILCKPQAINGTESALSDKERVSSLVNY